MHLEYNKQLVSSKQEFERRSNLEGKGRDESALEFLLDRLSLMFDDVQKETAKKIMQRMLQPKPEMLSKSTQFGKLVKGERTRRDTVKLSDRKHLSVVDQ